MTPYLKCCACSQTLGQTCLLRWIRITAAFQQFVLPTTWKMSTHSNFKAIIHPQNRCDTALDVCLFYTRKPVCGDLRSINTHLFTFSHS